MLPSNLIPFPIGVQIGCNLGWVNAQNRDRTYADLVKQCSGWLDPNFGTAPVPVDAAGWPLADCMIHPYDGVEPLGIGGTYRAYCDKHVTFSIPFQYATLANQVQHPDGTTTADIIVPHSGSGQLFIQITGTNGGFTSLKIMRPVAADSTESHAVAELFGRESLAFDKQFAGGPLRGLDSLGANRWPNRPDNPNVALHACDWPTRRKPEDVFQCDQGPAIGIAVEHFLAACNAAECSAYIPVSDCATRLYVVNLGLACLWGTDGVDPYTGPPGSTTPNPETGQVNPQPAGGPLFPGVRRGVYVESSNEWWNIFSQNARLGGYAVPLADELKNPDGDASFFAVIARYPAYHTIWLSDLFKEALGAAAYGTFYRPVMMGMQVNPGWMFGMLAYLKYAAQQRGVAPSSIVWGAGCSFYWHLEKLHDDQFPPDLTNDEIIAGGIELSYGNAYAFGLAQHAQMIARTDPELARVGYEGGLVSGDTAMTGRSEAIQQTPAFGTRVKEALVHIASFLDVMTIFCKSAPPWWLTSDVGKIGESVREPKLAGTLAAMDQLGANGKGPAPSTAANLILEGGFEVPSVLNASNSTVMGPGGSAWSFTGGAGITAVAGAYMSNQGPAAGVQVALIQQAGTISQPFTLPAAAQCVVRFKACQRNSMDSRNDFEVRVDGAAVAAFTPVGYEFLALETPTLDLGGGPHALTFAALNTVGGDNTVFIDEVECVVVSGGGTGTGGSGTGTGTGTGAGTGTGSGGTGGGGTGTGGTGTGGAGRVGGGRLARWLRRVAG